MDVKQATNDRLGLSTPVEVRSRFPVDVANRPHTDEEAANTSRSLPMSSPSW